VNEYETKPAPKKVTLNKEQERRMIVVERVARAIAASGMVGTRGPVTDPTAVLDLTDYVICGVLPE